MESELVVNGAIVDSWVEPSGLSDDASRLVLQVAPKGRPKDLVIVEAEASLVPDQGWLEILVRTSVTAALYWRSAAGCSMASCQPGVCNSSADAMVGRNPSNHPPQSSQRPASCFTSSQSGCLTQSGFSFQPDSPHHLPGISSQPRDR